MTAIPAPPDPPLRSASRRRTGLPFKRWTLLPLSLNIALCAIIYATGLILAFKGEPLAFARSGAAATAVCVALSLWDARRILDSAARIEQQALLATVDNICQQSRTPGEIADELEARLRGRFTKTQRRSTAVEAALLVTATLVWGFGDLPFAPPA